jgi:hypothetical protein
MALAFELNGDFHDVELDDSATWADVKLKLAWVDEGQLCAFAGTIIA